MDNKEFNIKKIQEIIYSVSKNFRFEQEVEISGIYDAVTPTYELPDGIYEYKDIKVTNSEINEFNGDKWETIRAKRIIVPGLVNILRNLLEAYKNNSQSGIDEYMKDLEAYKNSDELINIDFQIASMKDYISKEKREYSYNMLTSKLDYLEGLKERGEYFDSDSLLDIYNEVAEYLKSNPLQVEPKIRQ